MAMAEARFYLLKEKDPNHRYQFACRLIEKIYRDKLYCYVQTDDQQSSQYIDQLLWTFRAGSFIPHQIYEQSLPEIKQTVLIGNQNIPANWQQVIVNVSQHTISCLDQSELIFEVIENNDMTKQRGRERYRTYKSHGFSMQNFQI